MCSCWFLVTLVAAVVDVVLVVVCGCLFVITVPGLQSGKLKVGLQASAAFAIGAALLDTFDGKLSQRSAEDWDKVLVMGEPINSEE